MNGVPSREECAALSAEGRLELIAVKPVALRRINRIRKEMREGKGHGPFTVEELEKELLG